MHSLVCICVCLHVLFLHVCVHAHTCYWIGVDVFLAKSMTALRGTPTENTTGTYSKIDNSNVTENNTQTSDAIAGSDSSDNISSSNAVTRENFSEVVMDTFFTAMTLDDR
jgi:hypothetical protein